MSGEVEHVTCRELVEVLTEYLEDVLDPAERAEIERHIVSNRARTRAVHERRTAPFSSLAGEDEGDEAAVDADRFRPAGDRWAGHWAAAPGDWAALPEERLLARETLARVRDAIATLPPRQADVLVLRDVHGWEPAEVASAMGITDANQRVLLHRARSKVRAALELYFAQGVAA